MGLFRKSKPALLPIENEEQVIEWLLRYSDDEGCQFFRKLYKGKISKIITSL